MAIGRFNILAWHSCFHFANSRPFRFLLHLQTAQLHMAILAKIRSNMFNQELNLFSLLKFLFLDWSDWSRTTVGQFLWNSEIVVCIKRFRISLNKPTSYKLLLPRLPQDLLAGCRPLHVQDWVDFTLGLSLASLGEGAVEDGLTSAILGVILGIVGGIFFLTSSLPDGDLLLWTLSAGNLVISNCWKHCFENGMSPIKWQWLWRFSNQTQN